MLENLRAIKAKHTALSSQVKEIAAAQKESMDSIRNNLNTAKELVQHFQQTTDEQVPHCVLILYTECFIFLSLCECHTVDDVLYFLDMLPVIWPVLQKPFASQQIHVIQSYASHKWQMHLLNMRQNKLILQAAVCI